MSAQSTSASGQLEPGWWVRGLALAERANGTRPTAMVVDDAVRERFRRWRERYGPDGADRFTRRLAESGVSESALVELLAETPASLSARVRRPEWADLVERALRAEPPRPAEPARDWRAAFAGSLRPLVAVTCDRLTSSARELGAAGHLDLAAVAEGFTEGLRRRLAGIAARSLVLELNAWRAKGRLAGADGGERFTDFVRRLSEPARLAELFTTYPVLARLLGEACRLAADTQLELLARFAADRTALVETLFGGVDPGPVVAIEAGRGDLHRQHRSVSIVVFADGRRVVYRPRDVGSYARFAGLVDRLNAAVPGLGLRTVTVLARAGYGWLEFITAGPLPDRDGADRFYRRQGALLALLHALCASDIHYENLIACGDQPVLVDVETLFHPDIPRSGTPPEPAAAELAASVHRTLLLPTIVVGEHGTLDLSGLGGDCAGASPMTEAGWESPGTDRMRLVRRASEFAGGHNRPRLGDQEVDPGDHEAALLDGFRHGYDAIVRDRPGFGTLVEGCAGLEVRIVFRNTRGYQTLIDECTHPDLLGDGLDRDRTLDVLWTDSAGDRVRARLCEHEAADLWTGDVPLFVTPAGGLDVHASDGRRVTGLLPRSGLNQALDRIAGMGEADRRVQEWVISATLATRRPVAGHHGAEPAPGPLAGTAAYPQRLLAAACAIGDQIVARSAADRERVNWLGLELVDDRQWLVLPMGAGLANGYLGVALFLAQLTELSGIARYGEVARRAISVLPGLLEAVAGQPELVAAIGPGGLHGFGGIGYGLARLAVLLGDTDLRQWTRTVVEHAATAVARSGQDQNGWATGRAGCLAAMTAVHAELRLDTAARLATVCADQLVELVEHADGPYGCASGAVPPGFADGAAGIGWALVRCGEATGSARRVHAGRTAVCRALAAIPADRPGWCSGAAGVTVATTCLDNAVNAATLERALRVLTGRGVLCDLSLCHGELGIAEALTILDAERFPDVRYARRHRAGLVLDAIDRYGPGCGTPGGVSTPGLLSGLAGIGYGLLRLGFAERVPSVLLLEPTPGLPPGR